MYYVFIFDLVIALVTLIITIIYSIFNKYVFDKKLMITLGSLYVIFMAATTSNQIYELIKWN